MKYFLFTLYLKLILTLIILIELLTIIPAKEGESIDEAAAAKLLDRMVKVIMKLNIKR